MAFNEKAFLSSIQEKVGAGEAEWTAGVPGCNPPTIYSVTLGDYRADVVALDDGFQLWCYDSQDRLAEIEIDQKFLDGISVAPPEEKEAEPAVDITAKKEAMAIAVAAYVKEAPKEESDASGVKA